MPDRVVLKVNGREFSGWKSARITRGIEAISGSFALGVSETWSGRGQPWPIGEGDSCSLELNGEPLITGAIDTCDREFGARSHSVSVAGRDATGDLVDSSVSLGKWEFREPDVLTLARRLCEPFGVAVSVQAGVTLGPALAKVAIDPGDTYANALENLCRSAGVLPVSDGVGGLVLTRAGTARCPVDLVQGVNLLGGRASFSMEGRFRRYEVIGQHQGTDELNGSSAAKIRGTAEDLNVPRAARVLVVRAEGNTTPARAKARAEWEAATRAARADKVSVTVQGWGPRNVGPWPINALVRVRAPALGVNGEMLIVQATYSLDAGGTTTALELRRPDAFRPEPTVPKGDRYWKEIRRGALT